MGVKVATACFQWSQPIVHHSTLASIVSSPSSTRRNRSDGGALTGRYVRMLGRPVLFGIPLSKFQRSRSCCSLKPRIQTIRRACSANFDGFSDEEFAKQIQELALRIQISAEDSDDANAEGAESVSGFGVDHETNSIDCSLRNHMEITPPQLVSTEPSWPEIHREPPEWSRENEIIPDDVERKANSVDFPLSLRILKRKMQWHEGIREVRESAYCSVKKAFSSMVFMIQELHSYSLKLREILFYEDLQGILNRVEKEMQASFVWLFQQVFSHTPTLMVYVMILLANFTVYSMGNNSAIAACSSPGPSAASTQMVEVVQLENRKLQKFDSSTVKTFSVSSFSGKSASIGGGNGGGGGKVRPIASGTDGDEFNHSVNYSTVMPDGTSQLSSIGTSTEEESISGENIIEEEQSRWDSMVEEASQIQASTKNEAIDQDVKRRFVSPVTAKIVSDDYTEYFRTNLMYQTELSHDPNNPLLLTNYAQFLYLVAHDYDRAEEYFKMAVEVKPHDAEAYNKYGAFLWRVRKDLWTAEELFLEAIAADTISPFYAASYAHFLWNSGAEDTCFPNPPSTA